MKEKYLDAKLNTLLLSDSFRKLVSLLFAKKNSEMSLICQKQGPKTSALRCSEGHFFTILSLLQPLQRWSQLPVFLRRCSFALYEFDTIPRGDHSKNLFQSIFPKQ